MRLAIASRVPYMHRGQQCEKDNRTECKNLQQAVDKR